MLYPDPWETDQPLDSMVCGWCQEKRPHDPWKSWTEVDEWQYVMIKSGLNPIHRWVCPKCRAKDIKTNIKLNHNLDEYDLEGKLSYLRQNLHSFTEIQLLQITDLLQKTCKHCLMNDDKCQCWNDE